MKRPDSGDEEYYEELNWLGRSVMWGGAAVRAAAWAVDRVAASTEEMAVETRRAFEEGLSGEVEEARVLEEWDEER